MRKKTHLSVGKKLLEELRGELSVSKRGTVIVVTDVFKFPKRWVKNISPYYDFDSESRGIKQSSFCFNLFKIQGTLKYIAPGTPRWLEEAIMAT